MSCSPLVLQQLVCTTSLFNLLCMEIRKGAGTVSEECLRVVYHACLMSSKLGSILLKCTQLIPALLDAISQSIGHTIPAIRMARLALENIMCCGDATIVQRVVGKMTDHIGTLTPDATRQLLRPLPYPWALAMDDRNVPLFASIESCSRPREDRAGGHRELWSQLIHPLGAISFTANYWEKMPVHLPPSGKQMRAHVRKGSNALANFASSFRF